MSWQMRIIDITTEAQARDADGLPITIDLAAEGRFAATVEYVDDAAPATILHTQRFDFGPGTTTAQALQAMKAAGRHVRDAKNAPAAFIGQLNTSIAIDG